MLFLFLGSKVIAQTSDLDGVDANLRHTIQNAIYKDAIWWNLNLDYLSKQQANVDLHLTKWREERIQPLAESLRQLISGSYPGGILELEIRKSSLKYPVRGWTLYEVELPFSEHNIQWFRWNHYYIIYDKEPLVEYAYNSNIELSLYPGKRWMVAFSKRGGLKLVSGFNFKDEIESDFRLSPGRIQSYCNYVQMRYYTYFDSVTYLKREVDTLIFMAEGRGCRYSMALNLNYPENGPKEIKTLEFDSIFKQKYFARYEVEKMPPMPFRNFAYKEAYLEDMLMRNLYLYRIFHSGAFKEPEKRSYSLFELPILHPYRLEEFERVLPDYNEYIGHIELFKFSTCTQRASELEITASPYRRMSFTSTPDTWRGNRYMITGFSSSYEHLRFYALLKTRDEVLIRDAPVEGSGELSWRKDAFYFPESPSDTLPSPLVLDVNEQKADPCPDFLRDSSIYARALSKQLQNLPPVSLYWVAMDELTREVFFVSGEGIFLSPAVRLYHFGRNPYYIYDEINYWSRSDKIGPFIWFNKDDIIERRFKLRYISDRLFQYGVFGILQNEVVEETLTKTVVETQSHYPVKGRRLRATFYEDRPEEIEVEWLDN